MPTVNLSNNFKVASQIPLDAQVYALNLSDLQNLGDNNNKAFAYYDSMIVICSENKKQYIWKERNSISGGLLSNDFTYPENTIANGLDYSNKSYNFFEYKPEANIFSENKLINGSVYPVQNLDFESTPIVYMFDNQINTTLFKEFTLTSLNGSSEGTKRRDVFAIDVNLNEVIVIEGVPSLNPQEPTVNFQNQIRITDVLITSESDSPSGVTSQLVYDEGVGEPTEWDTELVSGSEEQVAINTETVDANNGVNAILFKRVTRFDTEIKFTNNVEDVPYSSLSSIKFPIKKLDTLPVNIKVWLSKDGAAVSNAVNVTDNTFGYQDNVVDSYQIINIPVGEFGLTSDFNEIHFSVAPLATLLSTGTFLLDTVEIISGFYNNSDTITEFIELNDTPDSYEGHGGKRVVVKDDETGLEFERIEENLSEFNNDVGFITESEQTPPVHETYTNPAELFADQANQVEGYFYGITDATGFDNILQGRATVSYKGTTNGDETDYNIEWKYNSELETIKITDYNLIPLQSGCYYVENAELETNTKSLEDDSYYIFDNTNLTVYRTKQTILEGSYVQYIDTIYKNGIYLGSKSTNLYGGVSVVEGRMFLDKLKTPYNYYNEASFVVDDIFNFARIRIENITEDLINKEGFIKLPYDINAHVVKSRLTINEKSLSHEFVYISDSVNETVTPYIRLLSGYKDNNNLFLNNELVLEFEYSDGINKIQSFEPITKEFTTDGSGLIINDGNSSHSNYMKLWVQEYINNNLTGTPPTIIGYENSDVSLKVGYNQYRVDTMYLNNSDLVCSASTGSFNSFKQNDQNKDIFKVISLGSNSLIRQDRTTSENDFLADVVMVTSRAETDNDGTDFLGTSYGFGVEFNEPTRDADLAANGMTDTQASDNHEQSPATAIVAAKFKWLRNETGAPWGLIREACRATASNANNYNIYRGFGQIDAAAAKTYIENNIDTWTGVNTTELAEYYDAISPYNTAVTFEEKTDKTPVVKKDLVEELSTLNANLEALINGKVSKSGDTMTGLLTLEDELIVKKKLITNQNRFNSIAIENYSQNNAWAIRSNSNLANYSGLFFLNHRAQYGLRDETGTLKAEIKSAGISYFNGGNVAIGQTTASEKLDINGKVKADSILLKSPDGNYHEVTVDNAGNLVVILVVI